MKTLYKNANVITVVDDKVLNNTDILVEDKKIIKIEQNITEKADQVVDCKGLYAIPGLIESHMHTTYSKGYENGEEFVYKVYVAYGVTTMRNMSGNMQHSPGDIKLDTFKVKQNIEVGKIIAPTLVNTSNILDGDDPYQQASRIATTIPNAKTILEEEVLQNKADQIKVYEHMPADVFEYVCNWADEHNIKVVGHIPKPVDKDYFCKRAYTLEHTISLRLDEVDKILNSDCLWVPTIIVEHNVEKLIKKKYKPFLYDDNMRYISPNMVANWNMYAPIYHLMSDDPAFVDLSFKSSKKKIEEVYKAGKEVAAGTDYPNPFIYPGSGLHDELDIIKSCCKSNYMTLRSGTIMGAKACELEDRKGTLEVGKDADIVFLRKNPLNSIKNARKIEKVVLMGKLFNREDLDQLLKEAIINPEYV